MSEYDDSLSLYDQLHHPPFQIAVEDHQVDARYEHFQLRSVCLSMRELCINLPWVPWGNG